MKSRRFILGAGLALAVLSKRVAAIAAPPDSSVDTVRSFYAVLLSTMKDGVRLGFAGRRDRLAPAIRRDFNLPLMTRLIVGPPWQGLSADQQQQLIDAFSNFSIATYANRFDDYSGERFDIEPVSTDAGGDAIVHTRLVPSADDPVQIDYLLRVGAGNWQIIDVYLSGTVSELATRHAEFSSVLRRSGPDALVDLLQRRTAQLAS